MHEGKYVFCNNQDFASIDSTGEVSDNVLDMELDALAGNTIITDDQLIGFVNITVIAAPAQATISATEGIQFQVRTAAAAALTSLYEICGCISVLPSKLVAGAQFSIPVNMSILQEFIGVWVKDISTDLVGTLYIDAVFSYAPVTGNKGLQKVPA